MGNIICYGELLIDLISDTTGGVKDAVSFKKYAGGAAANVAAQIKRLGGDASYLGKIGGDPFGEFLIDSMKKHGVDTSYVIVDPNRRTTLAFVGLNEEHIPEYLFYRAGGASETISEEEISLDLLNGAKVIYTSSLMLTIPKVQKTTGWVMDKSRSLGVKTAFDMNFRKSAWSDLDEARRVIKDFIKKIDILKINDDEVEFLYGSGMDINKAGEELIKEFPDLEIAIVTCGGEGSYICSRDESMYRFDVPKVDVVDTTGAGDSYMGAFLYKYASEGEEFDLNKAGRFASCAAALTVTKPGVIDALPNLLGVNDLLGE